MIRYFLHLKIAPVILTIFTVKKGKKEDRISVLFPLELLSRLELPNLFLTKEALYRLSYNSIVPYEHCYYIA